MCLKEYDQLHELTIHLNFHLGHDSCPYLHRKLVFSTFSLNFIHLHTFPNSCSKHYICSDFSGTSTVFVCKQDLTQKPLSSILINNLASVFFTDKQSLFVSKQQSWKFGKRFGKIVVNGSWPLQSKSSLAKRCRNSFITTWMDEFGSFRRHQT